MGTLASIVMLKLSLPSSSQNMARLLLPNGRAGAASCGQLLEKSVRPTVSGKNTPSQQRLVFKKIGKGEVVKNYVGTVDYASVGKGVETAKVIIEGCMSDTLKLSSKTLIQIEEKVCNSNN